jgi:hypothetical protein
MPVTLPQTAVAPGAMTARPARQSALRAFARVTRAVDRAIGRAIGPRRILAEARLPMHFVIMAPVIEELRRDRRLDVRVTSDGRPEMARTYAAAGLNDRVLARPRAAWQRFDLYMNGDPWYPAPLRRCGYRLNFFHGVAGKYDLDRGKPEAGLFDAYDRIAFVNADRMRRYLSGGLIAPEQAALVGYPKLDRLVNGAFDAASVRAAHGMDPARPTVLYGPTWSSASSLAIAGESIIATLLDLGLNVFAKLHDLCVDAAKGGDPDWPERLRRFERSGRFVLVSSADATPYLAASDLLVTDHSSIGFEFLALDRPLVVFDAPELPEAARINPEKIALLRSAADVVDSCEALSDAVSAALAEPSRLSAGRRRVTAQVFHQPGTATLRALDLVYSLLDLEPPSRATGARAAPAGRRCPTSSSARTPPSPV